MSHDEVMTQRGENGAFEAVVTSVPFPRTRDILFIRFLNSLLIRFSQNQPLPVKGTIVTVKQSITQRVRENT
jgi:hypothetical protein